MLKGSLVAVVVAAVAVELSHVPWLLELQGQSLVRGRQATWDAVQCHSINALKTRNTMHDA